VGCSVLQCVAVCCSVLRSVRCSMIKDVQQQILGRLALEPQMLYLCMGGWGSICEGGASLRLKDWDL